MDINKISNIGKVNFKQEIAEPSKALPELTESKDLIQLQTSKNPQISDWQFLFSRLNDEQIEQVNKSKMLPPNGKFVMVDHGRYTLVPNWINLFTGTRKLPAGFELRKDILGFSVILPIDSEGLFVQPKVNN